MTPPRPSASAKPKKPGSSSATPNAPSPIPTPRAARSIRWKSRSARKSSRRSARRSCGATSNAARATWSARFRQNRGRVRPTYLFSGLGHGGLAQGAGFWQNSGTERTHDPARRADRPLGAIPGERGAVCFTERRRLVARRHHGPDGIGRRIGPPLLIGEIAPTRLGVEEFGAVGSLVVVEKIAKPAFAIADDRSRHHQARPLGYGSGENQELCRFAG